MPQPPKRRRVQPAARPTTRSSPRRRRAGLLVYIADDVKSKNSMCARLRKLRHEPTEFLNQTVEREYLEGEQHQQSTQKGEKGKEVQLRGHSTELVFVEVCVEPLLESSVSQEIKISNVKNSL